MNEAKIVLHLLFSLLLRDALHFHSELNVLCHGEPWKEAEFLEDQDAIGAGFFYDFTVDQDLS